MSDNDVSSKSQVEQPLPEPMYPCPYCGDTLWDDDTEWMSGLDDATEVPGEGDYRAVHHCPICETAVVRRV